MDKNQLTLRITSNERQMLKKRALRYGMTMNGLIRFWINSEPSSPRAFSKMKCSTCDGTGKIAGEYLCSKCRGVGYSFYEV